MDKYNIISNNNKIKINCFNKLMANDLTITFNGSVIKKQVLNKIPVWEDILNDVKLTLDCDNVFYASNGIDCYGSYSDSNKLGIYYYNLNTKERKQIYLNNYDWKYFFEDSKGNIYVGRGENDVETNDCGFIHLKDGVATQICSIGTGWHSFFEDSKGNVYAGGYRYAKGVYHLNGKTITQIYSQDFGWDNFYEDSKGNVYLAKGGLEGHYPTGDAKGILYLDNDNATLLNSPDSKKQYNIFFETTKGELYIANDGASLLYVNGTELLEVSIDVSVEKSFAYFYEDSKGNVYVSSNYVNGIFLLKDLEIKRIYETGRKWSNYFTNSKGDLYANSESSGGVVQLDGETVTEVLTSARGLLPVLEDNEGNIYLTSKDNYGSIFWINGKTGQSIYTNASRLRLYLSKDNNVYFSTVSSPSYVHYVKGSEVTQISSLINEFVNFVGDSKGNVYLSSEKGYDGIYKVTPEGVTKIYSKGNQWKYSLETSEGLYVFNKEFPECSDDSCILIKDGAVKNIYLSSTNLTNK